MPVEVGLKFIILMLGFAIWFWSQRRLGERKVSTEIVDKLLIFVTPFNAYLHRHDRQANLLLIISNGLVDLLTLWLIYWMIVTPSFLPLFGFCLIFALRQLCQYLCSLPKPENKLWRYPGFPSLFITYNVSTDMFFSGHTALAVYGALQLAELGSILLTAIGLFIVILEIATQLVIKGHYFMDIYAGLMTALAIHFILGES